MADTINSPAKLIKTVDYRNAVHYKVGGSTGTRHPKGTWQDPCGSLANVRTMLTARKLDTVNVHGGLALDADMTWITWVVDLIQHGYVFNPNLFSVNGGKFSGVALSGVLKINDSIFCEDCYIALITNKFSLGAKRCFFRAGVTIPLVAGGAIDDGRISSFPLGTAVTFILNPSGTPANDNWSFTNWHGDIAFSGLTGGIVIISGSGCLTINASCTGGDIYIDGDIKVTNLGTSTVHNNSTRKIVDDIYIAVTGGAADVRFERSASGTVEEDAYQDFDISIYDIDAGAVAAADIDITAISAIMEKSTGGGAFSSVGITQPTFAKADGRVYCAYRFLAAEWAVGDLYRLRVIGITAAVDGSTVYVTAMVWSNAVIEAADIDAVAEAIKVVTDKIAGATGILFEQADVPVNVNAILASETDILDLTIASTRYVVRDLILKCVNPGAETVTVRLYKLINDAETLIDTFPITTDNYTNYFHLMDLFGSPQLSGDNIRVAVIATAAGPYAVTGQYSYAKTNV